ncbi:unnamed protein product, partial [Candidula unifasciata]
VAEKLGLIHISTGEGKERHIQVSKENVDNSKSQNTSVSEEAPSTSLLPLAAGVDLQQSDQISAEKFDEKEDTYKGEMSSSHPASVGTDTGNQTENIRSSGGEPSAITAGPTTNKEDDTAVCDRINDFNKEKTASDVNNKESKSNKKKNKAKQKPEASATEATTVKSTDSEICKNCRKSILKNNLILHELHCSKQNTSSATKGKDKVDVDVRKKDNESKERKKDKPKQSHVQKASDILSKIDDDDFEGLIASITELDSKCAFKKCKTLTNTLGRNCEYCTRRFCLTHLMPEIHGCGDAVRTAARRIISRDGVLHSGSGVPNKKPNQARRAQLESKMEKKLGELAGKRSRNL